MNKEALLEVVRKAEMPPLIDQEENPGSQIGWYKMCNEPIPELDEFVKESSSSLANTIAVERRHIGNTYQYVIRGPLSWFR